MSQLIQLRQRIKSIQTTKKITYAMRLISMSLYTKLEKMNQPLNYYQASLDSLFLGLARHFTSWQHPLLFPEDILNERPLFIIAASSKGLCGSFNSNLFRYLKRYLFPEEHQTPTFITVGQKATKFVEDEELGTILCSYSEFNSNNFLIIADELARIISAQPTPFSSITTYGNTFKSFFAQRPTQTIITPVTIKHLEFEAMSSDSIEHLTWEQPAHEVLDTLAVRYLKASILHALFQSLLAEQASRFVAMDQATTNADHYLERLTLQYNKSRQSMITRELSELSTSFGAQY